MIRAGQHYALLLMCSKLAELWLTDGFACRSMLMGQSRPSKLMCVAGMADVPIVCLGDEEVWILLLLSP